MIITMMCIPSLIFFFFQAEDGIRDLTVTGVQTCALPISRADFLILIKPQFELRRQEIARGGIVKDQNLHDEAVRSVREFVESLGLDCLEIGRASCRERV